MRTKVIVNRSNKKEFTINEIDEGEYFLDENQNLCVRTEDIITEDSSNTYSNAIRLDNGRTQIFTNQKLRLIQEIKIEYQV